MSRYIACVAFVAALAPWPLALAQITTSVRVGGTVEQPLTLGVEDLKQFAPRRIEDVRIVEQEGRREERTRRYVGVLLRDVLDRAKPVEKDRLDLRRSAILATASDGYKVVFSWAELYLSPIGDGVLVYYEVDGKPLDHREGRIALASLKDTRPGPRHVRWLQSLEVVRVGQ